MSSRCLRLIATLFLLLGARVQAGVLDADPGNGRRFTISGHVVRVLKEGLVIACADAYERESMPTAPHGVVGGAPLVEGTVILLGYPDEKQKLEHDKVPNVIAREAGTASYEKKRGVTRTVHAYQFVSGR